MAEGSNRPTKKTPEVKAAVLRGLALGLSLASSAKLAGISPASLHSWRKDDPEWLEETDKARMEAVARVTDKLLAAAESGNVQAMSFWLARRAIDFSESALEREAVEEGSLPTAARTIRFEVRAVETGNASPLITAESAPTEQAGGC